MQADAIAPPVMPADRSTGAVMPTVLLRVAPGGILLAPIACGLTPIRTPIGRDSMQ